MKKEFFAFYLAAVCTLFLLSNAYALDYPFTDDMESTINWVGDPPWARSTEDAHSGSYSWTDSPGGPYGSSLDVSLKTASAIDITAGSRPMLGFWHRHNLEAYGDFGFVEVSTNGSTWARLFFVTGSSGTEWVEERIDLSEYAGESLWLRFRLVTNATLEYDGWYIDDVRVEENAATVAYPFFDDMESGASEANWVPSTWGRIGTDGHSGTHCWTDTPGGNGRGQVSTSLVLGGTIDLSGAVNPQLSFWHHHVFSYSAQGRVWVSPDRGESWDQLEIYSGSQVPWKPEQTALSDYLGLPEVLVRFEVWNSSGDGWYIDDVMVDEACENVFLDPPGNIGEHSTQLCWSESTCPDFVQYEIHRSTSPDVTRSDGPVGIITDPATTCFTDTNIPLVGTTYYYKVYILDSQGLYNQGSNEMTVTTQWGITELGMGDEDDMESGDKWGNDLPWGLTTEDAHSGDTSWTDSPGGNYLPNQDINLTTKLDLSAGGRPMLGFWHRYNLEAYGDFGYVEVSTDGSSWTKLYFVTGSSETQWIEERIDLSEYAGESLWLRFRLVTNATLEYDGWYIDDVRVEENAATVAYPFFDDMESGASEANWVPSTWGRIGTDGHSGTHCWTDTPGGNGRGQVSTSLVLGGTIDLSGAVNPQLSFWHHHVFSYSAQGRVWVSPDRGESWDQLEIYSGSQVPWKPEQTALSDYLGLPEVLVRFEVWNSVGDGWYIDDVIIGEDGAGVVERIVITPDSMSLLIGETLQFDATGYDEYDDEVLIGGLDWSVRGNIGTIDRYGLFAASQAGIGAITAIFNDTIQDITGIIEVVDAAGGTTQIEQGSVLNSDSGVPPDDCIYFNAFVASRPDDVLTQSSPGCGYVSGAWQVNIGNFAQGWASGETLYVDCIAACRGEAFTLEYVLTNSGQIHDIYLEAIRFDLITTDTTNVNVITLVKDGGVMNAEELLDLIPSATEVAYWNAESQAYVGHSKGSGLFNFDVNPGYPYFVTVTAAGTWTPTGDVPDPWPTFDLITTGLTNVNMLGMPLQMLRVTKAEELGHMIIDAQEIGRWDVPNQAYEFHTYGAPLFDFSVKPALPYFVAVTDQSMWMRSVEEGPITAFSAPQNEGGYVSNYDASVPGDGEVAFEAYIWGREGEVLSERSPGCGYGSGYWQVNLGNFPSPWDAGEILHVDFQNTVNGQEGSLDITLEYLGQSTDITLAPIPCIGDFDGDDDVDGSDLAVFADALGSSVGEPDYNEEADYDEDETVDEDDLAALAVHLGRTDCQ